MIFASIFWLNRTRNILFTISLLSFSDSVPAKRSRSGRILKPRIFPASLQNRVISDIPIECDKCQVLVDQGMLEEYRNHHRTSHFEGSRIKSGSVNHGLAAVTPGLAAGKQRVAMRQKHASRSRAIFLEFPPKCSTCHNLRSTKSGTSAYSRHYRAVHLKIKEIICGNCGKEFPERGNLNEHNRAIHLKIKRFSCEICDKKFGHKGDLKKHKNRKNRCKLPRESSDNQEEEEAPSK